MLTSSAPIIENALRHLFAPGSQKKLFCKAPPGPTGRGLGHGGHPLDLFEKSLHFGLP